MSGYGDFLLVVSVKGGRRREWVCRWVGVLGSPRVRGLLDLLGCEVNAHTCEDGAWCF